MNDVRAALVRVIYLRYQHAEDLKGLFDMKANYEKLTGAPTSTRPRGRI